MPTSEPPSIDWLIEHFPLVPLEVEGGRFHLSWRSHRHWPGNDKPAGTAIVFLLTTEADQFSAFHRLPSDEVWHRYLGDPAVLVLLHADGHTEEIILGADLPGGEQVQVVVPAGTWMACYVPAGGSVGYALLGCSTAPGFTNDDYEGASRAELCAAYPGATRIIEQLTRPDRPLRMPAEH